MIFHIPAIVVDCSTDCKKYANHIKYEHSDHIVKRGYKIPPGYSFLASLLKAFKLAKNPILSIDESMKLFKGTYSLMLGGRNLIVTQNPDFVAYVLKGNHSGYCKSPLLTEKLGKFLGKGLLTSNGEHWRKQRRLLQPGFHADKIKELYAAIKDTVDNLLSTFPTGNTIDVYPQLSKVVFEILLKTLFNENISDANRNLLGKLIEETQTYFMKDIRHPFMSWWFTVKGEKRKNLTNSKRAKAIIKEIIDNRKLNPSKAHDILEMLLETRYEDTGLPMDEEQIIDEVLVMIIAGHESTSNVLAWALYLLATHPNELKKIRDDTAGLSPEECVRHDGLNAIIKEAMRLYPPAWISDRIALQDDECLGCTYPKGTIVMMYYYGLHRDPEYWNQPESFIPGRFLKENFSRENQKAYFPFGAGPRFCIGNNFAMAEMTIFLHAILHKFDFEPTHIVPTIKPLVTLRPNQIVLSVQKIL